MHSTRAAVLLAVTGGAVVAHAGQTLIAGTTFKDDPLSVVKAAAPAWHFDEATCFPDDGTDGKGGMNPGLPPDNCNELKVHHNCPPQPKHNGPNTEAASFPTYYYMHYCSDASWRILYDVYYPKDTGHRHDWEWAIVKFTKDGSGKDMWKRSGIWLQQDTKTPYKDWAGIPDTYNDHTDIDDDGNTGRDHPKLYVGKWHHPVEVTKYTTAFANTCPADTAVDYRDNDYRFEAADNLASGSIIKASWDYGDADSKPPAFLPGGKYDLCKF